MKFDLGALPPRLTVQERFGFEPMPNEASSFQEPVIAPSPTELKRGNDTTTQPRFLSFKHAPTNPNEATCRHPIDVCACTMYVVGSVGLVVSTVLAF